MYYTSFSEFKSTLRIIFSLFCWMLLVLPHVDSISTTLKGTRNGLDLLQAEDVSLPEAKAPGLERARSWSRRLGTSRCSTWTYSSCSPVLGVCGAGTRKGTRDGEHCKTKRRTFACKVPCSEVTEQPVAHEMKAPAGPAANSLLEMQMMIPEPRDNSRQWRRLNRSPRRTRGRRRKGKGKGRITWDRQHDMPASQPEGAVEDLMSICGYKRGRWSPCDSKSHTSTRVFNLVHGNRKLCELERVVKKRCKPGQSEDKKCRYQRQGWTECDPVTRIKTRRLTLKTGNHDVCEVTKIIERPCSPDGKVSTGWNMGRVDLLNPNKRIENRDCRYDVITTGPCDRMSRRQPQTLILRSGDESRCVKQKMVQQPCDPPETETVHAQPVTSERMMPPRDQPSTRLYNDASKSLNKHGKRKGRKRDRKSKDCNYFNADWSDCDMDSGSRSKVMTLRPDSPSTCAKTITKTKKCKKACYYTKGEWTACDPATNLTRREDTVISGSDSNCAPKRVATSPCVI